MRKKESKKLELEASPPSLWERGLGGEVPGESEALVYRWPRWYALVLGALAAEILFFNYLTHLFA